MRMILDVSCHLMIRSFFCFIGVGLFLGAACPLQAFADAPSVRQATVRGFVTDASNGEPLQGVNITLSTPEGTLERGAVSDVNGVYGISRIAPATYVLRASFVGYLPYVDTLALATDEVVLRNIALAPDTALLDEVLIETEPPSGAARVTAGLQSVLPRDIEAVPSPDVSGDLASYLTTLPGIVTLGDRGGQFFVRGGEPSHNLVLLDGMTVLQPFHMLGFYSVFPSDILNRVDVYAGGYPGRFTGRVSSVIDVYSRNGNKKQWTGAASVAPFVSTALVEGPILKDYISLMLSLRQSVIEQGAEQYISQALPYRFGDAFGKIHVVLNPNNQLFISALHSHDEGTLGEPTADRVLEDVRWRNVAIGGRYLFLAKGKPFFGEIGLSFSRFDGELGPRRLPQRSSEFEGLSYTVDLTYFIGNIEWKYGLFWRASQYVAVLDGLYQNLNFDFNRRNKAGIYLEPTIRVSQSLRIQPGLVAQVFPLANDFNTFVEPRLRAVWQQGPHEFSLATGLYHQEVVGLNDRRDATSIFTAWSNPRTTDAAQSTHLLVGFRTTPTPWLELSSEVYYKWLANLLIAEWTAFPRFTTRIQEADGRAMGLDLRVEVRRPHFYGYLNYGLSSVTYEAQQAAIALWYGTETLNFRPPHDRRHQVNALANLTVQGFDVSVRWNFGSGLPYNRIVGFDGFVHMYGVQNLFTAPDEQRIIYERPYRGVLPTYHRLDLTIARTFAFDRFTLSTQLGAINVYDRRNLFALDLFTLRRTDQLPFIPTLGVKVDFN